MEANNTPFTADEINKLSLAIHNKKLEEKKEIEATDEEANNIISDLLKNKSCDDIFNATFLNASGLKLNVEIEQHCDGKSSISVTHVSINQDQPLNILQYTVLHTQHSKVFYHLADLIDHKFKNDERYEDLASLFLVKFDRKYSLKQLLQGRLVQEINTRIKAEIGEKIDYIISSLIDKNLVAEVDQLKTRCNKLESQNDNLKQQLSDKELAQRVYNEETGGINQAIGTAIMSALLQNQESTEIASLRGQIIELQIELQQSNDEHQAHINSLHEENVRIRSENEERLVKNRSLEDLRDAQVANAQPKKENEQLQNLNHSTENINEERERLKRKNRQLKAISAIGIFTCVTSYAILSSVKNIIENNFLNVLAKLTIGLAIVCAVTLTTVIICGAVEKIDNGKNADKTS